MRAQLFALALVAPLVGAVAPSIGASRHDVVRGFDPDALMQPTFRAPAAPARTHASDQTLRNEAAELRVLQLEAEGAKVRFERESVRLRRASADRLRGRGVAVDWRAYDLATLHAWERRLAGGSAWGALAWDDDALLAPGSVPRSKVPRRRAMDADGVLAPGSVAVHTVRASWRRDPDALLPLGYAPRTPGRRPSPPADADAPLGY